MWMRWRVWLRRGMTACETSWTFPWSLMWDVGESLAVPLASSTTTTLMGAVNLLGGVVKTLFRFRTSGGDVTRRVLLGGVASEEFLCIDDRGWSFSVQKLSYFGVRRGLRLLGSASFLWWATRSSVASADEVGAAR
uniref:Uncharacterized protein n=1 Tax=Oryza rufipogon TaxID=4529 RepID=A0A0E0QI24_ORYRU